MGISIIKTRYWEVKLLDNQYYLGRLVIVLNRPAKNLSEINSEEILEFLEIVKDIERAFKKIFGTANFNWACLMNDAYKSEVPCPQVHFNLFPRYDKETKFEGEVFIDEYFAHHYDNHAKKEVSKGILNKIANKIKENL